MTLNGGHNGRGILGQDRALATLGSSLAKGQVHHAWILHGPFGVGKFAAALAMARLLLDPATTRADLAAFTPQRRTRVAALIDAGTHPDLHVITKERSEDSAITSLRDKKQTNIPIDLLRELMIGGTVDGRSFDGPVWRTPYLGHGKVFVIDEAELLDHVGQNALLKTLEEPPAGTTIILVTTREDRLLPTIRSRCQRVAFGPLDDDAMATWLASAKLEVEGEALERIRVLAAGSPGLATIAARHGVHLWARELANPVADLARGRFAAGLGDRWAELIGECADAVVKANPRASKEAANRLGARLLFGVLAEEVRTALRAATAEGAAGAGRARRWAAIADLLVEAEEELRRNLNLKQVLANLVAQWCERAPNASPAKAAQLAAGTRR